MVRKALEVYEAERLRKLEFSSRPIANLGHIIALVNGCKEWDNDWINDYAAIQSIAKAKSDIPKKTAELYLELEGRGIVPAWVSSMIDRKMIKYAAL